VVIDLPRPRKLGLVNSPSFGEYADHIRGLLDRPGALFRRTEGSE
jgi:hypothetical protein